MATLGDLVIKLSMDAAGFTSDAGRAAYQVEKSMARVTAAGVLAGQIFFKIGEAIGEMAKEAVRALPAIADRVAEQVDALEESAEAAQISAKAYQTLQVAMGEAGVSAEAFDSGLKKLNISIAEAGEDADSKAGEAFRRLGISVRDAQGNLKNAEQVLAELDKRFDTLPEGPEKVAIAVELMGKAGQKFIPALNADLNSLQRTAADTGQVFSDELVKAAEDYKDALADLRGTQQAFANSVAETMLGPMTEAINVFNEFLQVLRDSPGEMEGLRKATQAFFREVAVSAAIVVDAIKGVVGAFQSISEILQQNEKNAQRAKEAWKDVLSLDFEGAEAKRRQAAEETAATFQRIKDRFTGEPISVKLQLAFDASDAKAAQKKIEDALRMSAPNFGGGRPLEAASDKMKKTKRGKSDAEKAEDELAKATARLDRLQRQASEKEIAETERVATAEMKAVADANARLLRLEEKNAAEALKIRQQQSDDELELYQKKLKDEKRAAEKFAQELAEDQERINRDLTDDLTQPLLDFVQGTKSASEAFSDFIGNVTASLQRMAAQNLAEQIFGNLFKGSGGAGGLISQLFGSGFGSGGGGAALDAMDIAAFFGGMQHGGRFPANRMIRVGERGPEMLYTGNTVGHVEPMKEQQVSNNNININVNVPGQTDRRTADQIAAQVGVSVNRAMRRIN